MIKHYLWLFGGYILDTLWRLFRPRHYKAWGKQKARLPNKTRAEGNKHGLWN